MENDSAKQIRHGALLSYFSIGISILCGIFYTPWMIRELGRDDYGLYTFITVFISYFFIDFGLGNSIAKYIAEYKAQEKFEKINHLLSTTALVYVVVSAIVFVIMLIVYFYLWKFFPKFTPDELHKLKVIYCITGFFSILVFPFTPCNGILIAYERFIFQKNCDLVCKLALTVLMAGCLVLGFKLYTLVLLNSGIIFVSSIIKYFYIKRYLSIKINFRFFHIQIIRELVVFSFWVMLATFAQKMFINFMPVMLSHFTGTSQLAYFSIAITIEGYVWTFANALNGLFLYRLSQNTQNSSLSEINILLLRVGRFQFFILGAIIGGFVILGQDFIALWVGTDFEVSYWVGIMILIPQLLIYPMEIANTLLFVTAKLKYRVYVYACGALFCMLCSFYLIPRYEVIGAGIAIGITLLVFNCIGLGIVFSRKLNLDMKGMFFQCYLPLGGLFLITLLVGVGLNFYLKSYSFFIFILKSICWGIIYVGIMFFFGGREEEKKQILSFRGVLTTRKKGGTKLCP